MNRSATLQSTLPLILFAVLAGSAAWACFGERGILTNRTLLQDVEARNADLLERQDSIERLRQQIQAMRRQLVQRTRVARINTASAPPPGGAPGGRKRCPVCKGMFDATVWKAHSLECVDSIVRFSVAKSTAAVAAAPR